MLRLRVDGIIAVPQPTSRKAHVMVSLRASAKSGEKYRHRLFLISASA